MSQYKDIAERQLRVNGVELSYYICGTEGKNDLLFVHGYQARCSLYDGLLSLLAPHFKITALDLRAHGGSAKVTEGFTFSQLAEDIVSFAKALKLEKPLYVGHSLGGLLGLASAVKAPMLFSGLALLTPAAASGKMATDPVSIERAIQIHGDQEAMMAEFSGMYARKPSADQISAVVDSACLVDSRIHEYWLKEAWPKVDISTHLHEIKVPALLLNGSRDIVISPEEQHKTALALPHFKEVIFSGEGHMLPLEAPKTVAREITAFYEQALF